MPLGPATTKGRVLSLTYLASISSHGSPPKWSPCRWLTNTVSMSFGLIPSRCMPISDVAPQSMRNVEALERTQNEVWRRLPAPKASPQPISYTHLRAHETDSYLVCRLLLEKKKKKKTYKNNNAKIEKKKEHKKKTKKKK